LLNLDLTVFVHCFILGSYVALEGYIYYSCCCFRGSRIYRNWGRRSSTC